jgi:membrane protein DedA with SNARE-associated domain
MHMSILFRLIEEYGISLVFTNVLVEQLGAPIPAFTTLVVTGAMLDRGEFSAPLLLTTSVAAALLADFVWYLTGRRKGKKVLAVLCRISPSSCSCMQQTESVYTRWGPSSLLVAKFVPVYSSLVSALAGTSGTPLATFILFDVLGAAIWAGTAILLGSMFRGTVDQLLNVLEKVGKWAVLLAVVALVISVAYKLWQRRCILHSLHIAACVPGDEPYQLHQQGMAPVVIDARSPFLEQGARIPGTMPVPQESIDRLVLDIVPTQKVALYSAYSKDVAVAIMAKQLINKG